MAALVFGVFALLLPWTPLSAQVATQSEELTPIYAIQGSGPESPYVKDRVDTVGLITAVTNNGFYLQDPVGDDDPATSDGIFVYTRTWPNQSVGSCVSLTHAFVDEYYEKTELTEVPNRGIRPSDDCSGDEVTPVSVPFAQLYSDPQRLFERYEGMLVSFDRIEGVVHGPTKRFRGGDAEIAFVASEVQNHLAAGRIFQWQAEQLSALMYLSTPDGSRFPELGWGERLLVESTTGSSEPVLAVLDYNFGKYQLILLENSTVRSVTKTWAGGTDKSGSKVVPASDEEPPLPFVDEPIVATEPDEITVCTFNILGLGKGSDQYPKPDAYAVELEKRALAIAQGLNGCTIIGLQETGKPDDVTNLADLLREKHQLDYEPVAIAGPMTRNPEFPLTNSFLVRRGRVTVVAVELRQACTRLNYDVRYQPGVCERGTYGLFSRPPLMVDLLVDYGDGDGGSQQLELTVINNHWKSKGGDEEVNVVRREAQALHVAEMAQERLDVNPAAHVVVLGDLNDYYASIPVDALANATAPQLVHTYDFLPQLDRYTYTFNGASQVLDHILVTPGLVPMIEGVDPLHINADYPYALETDPTTVFHASDHDPVVLRLSPGGIGWITVNVGYPGVTLSLSNDDGSQMAKATSDELGDIRLWGIVPGDYTISMTVPDYLLVSDMVSNITIQAGPNEIDLPLIQHRAVNAGAASLLLSPTLGELLLIESQAK